jgi:hypothetical protein
VDIGIGGEEFGRQLDDGGGWSRGLEVIEKNGCDPLIGQNPPVLRIVEKLDHVEMSVIALEQVRLGSAAHFPDQAFGLNGHGVSVAARANATWRRLVRSSVNIAHNAAGRDGFHLLASASRAVRSSVNIAHNAAGRDGFHLLANTPRAVRSSVTAAQRTAVANVFFRRREVAASRVAPQVKDHSSDTGPDILN